MGKGFHTGDWVEVRPLSDILGGLDAEGALDGLPFMPEMARYCGRRFRIVASAHKTCDPTGASHMRRMPDTVLLETRCDGSSHDGCQARCRFYWKRAWLKPVDGPALAEDIPAVPAEEAQKLHAFTRYQTEEGVRYRCQATEIVRASTRLAPWHPGQYLSDIRSGNITFTHFVRYGLGKVAKGMLTRLGRLARAQPPCFPTASADPPAPLNLRPGEFVKVRSAAEITPTLAGNRGPTFEPEMLHQCGRSHRVLARVNRIIDERNGKMLKLRNDCVVLDGITCNGLSYKERLFCPRASYYFWREAWLERASEPPGPTAPTDPA